jgi:hypothetical protein
LKEGEVLATENSPVETTYLVSHCIVQLKEDEVLPTELMEHFTI